MLPSDSYSLETRFAYMVGRNITYMIGSDGVSLDRQPKVQTHSESSVQRPDSVNRLTIGAVNSLYV